MLTTLLAICAFWLVTGVVYLIGYESGRRAGRVEGAGHVLDAMHDAAAHQREQLEQAKTLSITTREQAQKLADGVERGRSGGASWN